MISHEQVREMVSAGEESAEMQDHLGSCDECVAWAKALDGITRASPTLYAEAPGDLSERVLTAVKTAAPVVVVAAASAGEPAEAANVISMVGRRAFTRAAVAAAVIGAVAATALLVPGDGGGASTLVAAVEKTRAASSARVTVSSSLDYRPAEPIEIDVPDVPNLGKRVSRRLPDELGGLRDSLAKLPAPEKPKPITRITSGVSATGEIVFPDRLHLKGTGTELTTTDGRVRGEFETIVIGDTSWFRTPLLGKKWLRLPGLPADISVDFHADHLLAAIARFDGSVEDRGETTLNGERVRHYVFADRRSFGSHIGSRSVTLQAWVGVDDGLMRRLLERHTSDERGRLELETDVRFSDFGADVTIEAPPKSQEITLDELVSQFFGYAFGVVGSGLSFSLEAAARMPEFAFPSIEFPDFKFELPSFEIPSFDFDFDLDFDFDVGAEFQTPDIPGF